MRRVFSVVVAVALLLALGALAVMALPPTAAPMAAAPAAFAAAPDAPTAAQNFNMIAMPLDATDQFTSAGYTFTADGLTKLIPGTVQAGSWDPIGQIYQTWTIDPEFGGSGTDFALQIGGAYWVLLDSSAASIVSFVGDVPTQGTVHFNFVGGSPCKFNEFSWPLDTATTTAEQLATQLSAQQVSVWDAANQTFQSWTVDPEFGGSGTNFTTKIGYPYTACLLTGAPSVWP